ncbi:protein-glucosylgalactosylhydroxylysine glucosidase-like [Mya arenaria]|uniref:protein-glucosylgalactosylhydroxylysine glucosidase-like n=1 Tax=Mya arenaria TaxID=6604 RepID=UPI0022E0CCC3|nr:protein-glucosylgalactosylhydroxylysine glucosidase-like [Mya arenaria]
MIAVKLFFGLQLVFLNHVVFSDYILESTSLPEVRFRPPIGNGHIATNVLSDTVYMNGMYNGREDLSSRARIPSYVAIDVNISSDDVLQRAYVLNMRNGIFYQTIRTELLNITVTYFAHRNQTRIMATRVEIQRRNTTNKKEINLHLQTNKGSESADFDGTITRLDQVPGLRQPVWHYSGVTRDPETRDLLATPLHVYYSDIPAFLSLPSNQDSLTVTFAASYSTDKDDALNHFTEAFKGDEHLKASHIKAWNDLWDEGRVDINGDESLALDIAAAQYNILCSLPSHDDPITPFYGLGPGGLSRGGLYFPNRPGGPKNDYAGHVFWDMDTWIMPPIMIFHPDMAPRMIGARTRVMEQVRQNARSNGYKGVQFPWEQAATGIEATPKWAGNNSHYEIHITADIAYSLRQYLYASNNIDIVLEGKVLELAIEIARFWQSRVKDFGDRVEILGVMGPDEYHQNVNNSVFTNYNAKLSLTLPQWIVGHFNLKVNDSLTKEFVRFNDTADRMLLLFDENRQFHPQYENYNLSIPIKQSDVVLLGYPLMMSMTPDVRHNDLLLYEQITDRQGPDTGTWSMHTVGWLEVGNETRAYNSFKMMFRNINEPFKVFSENPVNGSRNGGCVNFITGAGGLFQAIVFGYGGLRLQEDRLEINPFTIPGTTGWALRGIHYRSIVFDLEVDSNDMVINLRKLPKGMKLSVELSNERGSEFNRLDSRRFKRQHARLQLQDYFEQTKTVEHTTQKARAESFSGSQWSSLFILSLIIFDKLSCYFANCTPNV